MRAALALAIAFFASPTFAAEDSAVWQGTWSWQGPKTDDNGEPWKFPSSGEVKITDCHNASCQVEIYTGNESSVCSAECHLMLKSPQNAVVVESADGEKTQCELTLTQHDGVLEIDADGDECDDLCGHLGANFGEGYRRTSRANLPTAQ